MSNYFIIKLISNVFYIYNLLIFARIMSSWFSVDRSSELYRVLFMLTEPVLGPFREIFHRYGLMGPGLDFSPIAAIFALNLIKNFLIRLFI